MSDINSKIFQPIKIKNLELSNRIAMAPMTRGFSPNGIPGENVAAYYRRRAEAGVGLIITEGTVINHLASAGTNNVPTIYGEKALVGWQRVVQEVHEVGGRIIPQIWHVGYMRKKGIYPNPEVPGYGPVEIRNEEGVDTIGMTDQDIDTVITAFASAAKNARDVGFDGLEIHGAHEYLIDQFLWEKSNLRDDSYGGSAEKRMNFALDIVRAIREAVGPDFLVVFRFSQWKQKDYKAKLASSPLDLEKFLIPLTEAGVDVFHASTRRFWEPEFEGSDLNLAGWAKKITGKPSITVGSVGLDAEFISTWGGKTANPTGIEGLLERLDKDEFDLVAVGRAILADPDWVEKIKQGRLDEIVPFSKTALEQLI